MTARRLRQAVVEQLVDRLGDRDRAIVLGLARLRVLTGQHLTRLHFADLSTATRDRTRRRVLGRLASLGIVTTLERRIGGVRAGSAGLVYALDVAGQRILPLLGAETAVDSTSRARHPWTPGVLFLGHSLAVSELYVQLKEEERAGTFNLAQFRTEAASWHPNGFGGLIKPDASVLLQDAEEEASVWIEVDRATESLPTLRRKLLAYVDFANAGQLGPDDVTPMVLVAVPHERRLLAVSGLIRDLPEPAAKLIQVALFDEATHLLVDTLRNRP
jgi:hypothetical protein